LKDWKIKPLCSSVPSVVKKIIHHGEHRDTQRKKTKTSLTLRDLCGKKTIHHREHRDTRRKKTKTSLTLRDLCSKKNSSPPKTQRYTEKKTKPL